jgi:hypothetical protein
MFTEGSGGSGEVGLLNTTICLRSSGISCLSVRVVLTLGPANG